MCIGVTIASYGELDFDAPGLILQLISITAEAGRLIVTQNLLQVHLKGSSPLVSLSLFAPCCFFFLLPIALTYEPAAAAALAANGATVLANTLTAFTLNVAVVMLVSATSGLTLTLAGIIKDILLISASVMLLGSSITYIQVRAAGPPTKGFMPLLFFFRKKNSANNTKQPTPISFHRLAATPWRSMASTCTMGTGRGPRMGPWGR
jgi:hypothetical protein